MPIKVNSGDNNATSQNVTDNEENVINDSAPVTNSSFGSDETTYSSENDENLNNNTVVAPAETDPNKIKVSIPDDKTPIIVLFGPPSCGKTMTLVRLSRYLYQNGYKVEVDLDFKSKTDSHYQELVKTFDSMINSEKAAFSTDLISFLLVKVSDKLGCPVCQILEAPGEHYFNPNEPKTDFPKYINTIISSKNRILYSIFVEPSWNDVNVRKGYVEKVKKLSTMMRNGDKVLFVYNKIDQTNFVIKPGVISMNNAINNIKNLYPNIFEAFRNLNPITKFFKKYNCEVVPFQTGMFNKAVDGGLMYTQSDDIYPTLLWNKLCSLLKG